MGFTEKQFAVVVGTLGLLSFIFGVVAENKKPSAGTSIPGKGIVICQYPSDPTIAYGYLSVAFLVASTVAGWYSLFYPYQGKSVPTGALFKSTTFSSFFAIAVGTAGLAFAFLLWPTITEQLHRVNNIHQNPEADCPTAKTGLLGGGAFVSLDSCLFWLVALMLANNVREDYFGETSDEKDGVEGYNAIGIIA